MPRPRYSSSGETPPPLPPVARTVGQVVAEAIKLYQANLVPALALGLPVAVVDQLSADRSLDSRIAVLLAASPVLSVAYAAGCAIQQGERPAAADVAGRDRRRRLHVPPGGRLLPVVRARRHPLARSRGARRAGRHGGAARAGRRAHADGGARPRRLRPRRRLVRDAGAALRADAPRPRASSSRARQMRRSVSRSSSPTSWSRRSSTSAPRSSTSISSRGSGSTARSGGGSATRPSGGPRSRVGRRAGRASRPVAHRRRSAPCRPT